MSTVLARQDVPIEQTWDHESVFASFEAWQEEYQAVNKSLKEIDQYKGTLSQSPQHFKAWFDFYSTMSRRVFKVFMYPALWIECDGNNETIQGMFGQARGLVGQLMARASFADPELLEMDEATLNAWLDDPDLTIYKKYMDDLLRQRQHVRSAEVEEVLGIMMEPLEGVYSIRSALTNMDMKFPPAVDSHGEERTLIQSTRDQLLADADRELRKTAWNNYADTFLKYNNTLANAYLTSVRRNVAIARIRGFDNVLQSKLSPHNIPEEVFHNLIETYKKHIPTWHRYWDVRRRMLGYDSIHPYDIWSPLTPKDPRLTFNEAVDLIVNGMKPLGDDYVNTLKKGCLEERWVDYAINEGKGEGAFSDGSYDTHPFIMMSFDGNLSSMSTLAHELGHSMHSYYTRKTQPYIYSNYSMFVAEVASNFNQAMVRAHLFATHDDRDFQLALIQEAMDNIHRYFFIMPTLARFEYEIHTRIENDEPVTPDSLNGIMSQFYAEAYGDTMTDDPKRTGSTWAQFVHLYEPYYTFQYATGISAAHALCNGILAGDDPDAVSRYITFLSTGDGEYAIPALKKAGVDMSTPLAVEETFKVLEKLIDRLEGLIE